MKVTVQSLFLCFTYIILTNVSFQTIMHAPEISIFHLGKKTVQYVLLLQSYSLRGWKWQSGENGRWLVCSLWIFRHSNIFQNSKYVTESVEFFFFFFQKQRPKNNYASTLRILLLQLWINVCFLSILYCLLIIKIPMCFVSFLGKSIWIAGVNLINRITSVTEFHLVQIAFD